MDRRQVFSDIMAHKTPQKVLLDLCGCPLSEMTQEAEEPLFSLLWFQLASFLSLSLYLSFQFSLQAYSDPPYIYFFSIALLHTYGN